MFWFPWNHGSAVRALVGRVYLVCSGRRRNSIKALQKKEIEAGNWSFRLPPPPSQHSSNVGSFSLLSSILISTNSIGFAMETFYTFCLGWIEYLSRNFPMTSQVRLQNNFDLIVHIANLPASYGVKAGVRFLKSWPKKISVEYYVHPTILMAEKKQSFGRSL